MTVYTHKTNDEHRQISSSHKNHNFFSLWLTGENFPAQTFLNLWIFR